MLTRIMHHLASITIDWLLLGGALLGGALKERRNGRVWKRLSKHLRNGQQQAVNQKPAARLPTKDSHLLDQDRLWFQALCARRLWTENVLFGAHRPIANTRPLWLGQSYQGLKLCVSTLSSLFETEHGALPLKTRMDSSKHNEAICVRDARQESAISLDDLSGQ